MLPVHANILLSKALTLPMHLDVKRNRNKHNGKKTINKIHKQNKLHRGPQKRATLTLVRYFFIIIL